MEQRRTVALTVIHHAAGVRHLPVEGLYSSASAIGVLPVVVDPPAISTSPLGSRVAVWPQRAVAMLPGVGLKLLNWSNLSTKLASSGSISILLYLLLALYTFVVFTANRVTSEWRRCALDSTLGWRSQSDLERDSDSRMMVFHSRS